MLELVVLELRVLRLFKIMLGIEVFWQINVELGLVLLNVVLESVVLALVNRV
jgi:hypothetical protein